MKTKLAAAFLVLAVVAITLGTHLGPSPADCKSIQSTTEYKLDELKYGGRI